MIQREAADFLDPELRGRLASLGIQKGTAFAPDERMKRLLSEGVAIGNATARALCFAPRDPETKLYGPDSHSKDVDLHLIRHLSFL